jgi:Acyl-CoA oxidase
VEDALRTRAAYAIYKAVVHGFLPLKEQGVKTRALYNEIMQVDQVTFSNYHLAYFTVWAARNHLEKSQIKCEKLRKHVEALISLYGLNELAKDAVPLYECGYFTAGHHSQLQDGIKFITKALRPQYVSLIEAFDIPDCVLNSAVGNSYGDIYE